MLLDDWLASHKKALDKPDGLDSLPSEARQQLVQALREHAGLDEIKGADITVQDVVALWNRIAGPAGFPTIRSLSSGRRRIFTASIREYPHRMDWVRAIMAYVRSARTWTDRKKYGIETMLRASKRAIWFDASDESERTREEDYERQYT